MEFLSLLHEMDTTTPKPKTKILVLRNLGQIQLSCNCAGCYIVIIFEMYFEVEENF